jgi:multiple sugar transport system substrate-binding protein
VFVFSTFSNLFFDISFRRKRMKIRLSPIIVAVLIASLILAACSPAEATPTPAAPAAPGDTPAAPGTDPGETAGECPAVQLAYWNPFTGPDGPFMGQMVDSFNAEHPDITVTMNSQADYYTQLTTAAASGTLPDVAIVHADQVATQVYRNVLGPIDDIMGGMNVSGGDFPDAVWAAGEVNGTRYAIPLDIHPMTMFYNNDLMQQYNVASPPTTREEFEQAAAAMTAEGNFGFMITTGFPVAQIFQMLLHQFGGSEFNADGTEATWNSEAGVQALEWMLSAQQQYSEQNLEVDAELNAFRAGNAGMIWNGIWQTTNVTGDGVLFEGMATGVPQIGPEPAVWAGSHQLTVPIQAGESDACRQAAIGTFIQYLLDNSVTWAQAGQIPASNTVRESAAFQEVSPQAQIAPSVENAIFPPSVPGITDALGPMGEAVSAIMSGEATDIQATLDASAQRGNQILEENRQAYGDAPTP